MIVKITKCDPDILFKITKKEADYVLTLSRRLQSEFEDYQKLKYKFEQMINNGMVCNNFLPVDKKLEN